MNEYQTGSNLDLILERIVDVPQERVWEAWTTPAILMKWFTPAPWQTVACEIDLHPGGKFFTVMRSPEGQEFPGSGCFLEVVENQRLAWTNALGPGYRPAKPLEDTSHDLIFTAVITLEAHGNGTKYTALVIHGDPDTCKRHEAMGFHNGWGAALDQLVALVRATK